MYTLLELESKTFGALKKIGEELNLLPEGDRRRRETWINAIAGVNPPLLQLLEVSPAVEVQAQEPPIIETVETSASLEVEPVEEAPLESKFGRIVYPRPTQDAIAEKSAFTPLTRCFNCQEEDGFVIDRSGELVECPLCDGSRWKEIPQGDRTGAEDFLGVEGDPVQKPIIETVEASPGVEVEQAQDALEVQAQEPIESPPAAVECPSCRAVHALYTDKDCLDRPVIRCLHCSYCRIKNYFGPIRLEAQEPIVETVENSPGVEVDPAREPISQVAKNSPGVEVDQLPECVECFGDGYFEDESGLIKFCQCSSEQKLSRKMTQGAIVPAAKNHLDEESERNPILTGIPLSDRFVARYTPPQPEIIHFQSDADGQLSLLDFEVESVDEAPDPDDFESLDAFREVIERWDREHPSSFDHCSDHLPSSEQNEPLEISLESFCEWAPCPADWYEPDTSLEQSKVSELLRVEKSSITSDFFIPTFDRLGDRRSDEPPDTGIFAKLPKPKPPKFPPQAASQPQVGHKLNTS